MGEIISRLEAVQIPDVMTREGFNKKFAFADSVTLRSISGLYDQAIREAFGPDEVTTLSEVVELLQSEEFGELVTQGQITLAMVKPHANWYSRNGNGEASKSDEMVYRDIMEFIENPANYPQDVQALIVVNQVTTAFTEKMIGKFYDGLPRQNQEKVVPIIDADRFANRWEENVAFLASGPISLLIIYDPEGTQDNPASQKFRKLQGHWNPVKRNMGELRAVFAGGVGPEVDSATSVTHGSESPDDAAREFSIWTEYLSMLVDSMSQAQVTVENQDPPNPRQ